MASALLAVSSSYCYSDITYGTTPNAAATGLSWGMDSVLYDATPPWVTLEIGGLAYRYTMGKAADDNVKVHVRNEDAIDGGYIFEETDDWSGLPGGTIQKYFRFPYSDSTRWGRGSIDVEGNGTVTDPVVTYNYKLEINDQLMVCTTSPLLDPECPGYEAALYKYLQSLDTEPDINDPFYDEWVQSQLNQETELQEEEIVEEEAEEEEDLEKDMGGENTIEAMVGTGNQAEMLAALAQVPKIEAYYTVTIPGGEYQESIELKDTNIPDNRRALRNLASDANHRKMVRSQYDENKGE